MMNAMIWNCRGALKHSFKSHVQDLVADHDPKILVIMETHLGGVRAKEISDTLPFQGAIHTETVGYAGGLWFLWNTDRIEVTNLASTEQEIHALVKVRSSNLSWIFTAIYGSPRHRERSMLWENLSVVANIHNLPWVIAGDFNELMSNDDKFGGRPVNLSRALSFKECMDACNMADLGFHGPRFTWSNGHGVNSLIQERLDRFFANPGWCMLYPEAQDFHLTRCFSDHCPVLLDFHPHPNCRLDRPFKFQSFWLSDNSFPELVRNAWANHAGLYDSIKKFTREVKIWNRDHFGNIFSKKKRLLARLSGIQRVMADRPTYFLVNLEKELRLELNSILKQEEELWALKSRINWMIQGDRNTSFYHVSTLIRRKHNKILNLKNNQGDWINDITEVMDFVRDHIIKLFSTELTFSSRSTLLSDPVWPHISEVEANYINTPVSDEEIRHALWSLKPFKSPGPDGLHAGFFQRFWLVVGHSVSKEIKNIFQEKRIPSSLNQTHIALIPKINGPETVGNFRPISLCNTVYKIITKIIVTRIRPLMEKLVSPFQSAFVPGRKGVDNAIIAQEIIHTVSRKKGKIGHMIIKVDLEKAYDRLEWSFIREVLQEARFPSDLIQVIMSCVSSTSSSILFNGGVLDPFFPSRGVRQGDPLSPYLFILCMEVLGRIIEEKSANGVWNPVKASKSGPTFTNLFFADDLLVFAKADAANCNSVREAFDEFCTRSGQKINYSKTKVFFSPNVNSDQREEFCDILGFQSTSNLKSYLGFPLRHAGASN
ncbi:hypothetical protein SO802_028450 [Lithocarpus litseifolius]|uniref:Reverse transcriptase domain-containing protein n=1 Tax=Lithocarpus litseifolius TaxID=425828 RepID=A0AAW2BSD3_9ROSI